MDVEQVQQIAKQLSDAAEDITTIEKDLTSGLRDVDWEGPDADDFRGTWESDVVPALQQIMKAVEALGSSAAKNASEQAAVSSH
ncbi:hypothetical protein DEO23_15500 [Brachybacterium endophyticum]|uniref:WXG100 family type VII secretion target n=2 Tax=Brachybacterium endophyticum TaxID=2182385 RepID=A0A2U2RGZ7_9MICO|nr:hypothetical protein DEO23_15500 [Brachybacterium endophyticum]